MSAWLLPTRKPPQDCGASPAVVLFHGAAGSRSSLYPLASTLADHGSTVLLAEYRGFGGMAGTPSEDGLDIDARAALDALVMQPGVDPERVAYVGYSLGTGVAVRLATERKPAGLVLLAPYTSLPDAAWAELPGLPYKQLMRDRYDSLSRISDVDAPVTVVVGTADEVIPNDQSIRVFEAAKRPDRLVTIRGQNHGGVGHIVDQVGRTQVVDFIDDRAGCGD